MRFRLSAREEWGTVAGRKVCGVLCGCTLASAIFDVILRNSASTLVTPKRFIGVGLRNGFLHHPVSIYSCSSGAVALVCGIMNSNARRVSGVRTNRDLSLLMNLNGNFGPRGSKRGPLLVNNNMNIPPLCGLYGRLLGVNGAPAMVLNFGAGDRVFCSGTFTTLNMGIVIAAISNATKIGNFMASTFPRGCSCFFAYNPVPVFGTVRGATAADNRCDFRREVNYNFNTYVNYDYGAGCNGGQVYGSNPILCERRVV